MLKHPHQVRIGNGSELAEALEGVIADGVPRILVREGKTVAVLLSPDDYNTIEPQRQDDIWANYDPERVRRAFEKAAEAFRGIDRDEFLRDMHAAREQDSSGRHD